MILEANTTWPHLQFLAQLIEGVLNRIAFGVSDNYLLFIIAMIMFTIGEIFAFPTMNVMIDEIAPDTQKATYLGAAQFKNLGGFIGPIFGGWLLTHYIDYMFVIIALLVLCSSVVYKIGANYRQ